MKKKKNIYTKKRNTMKTNKQKKNKKTKSLSVLMAARSRIYVLDGLYSSSQCLWHATFNSWTDEAAHLNFFILPSNKLLCLTVSQGNWKARKTKRNEKQIKERS